MTLTETRPQPDAAAVAVEPEPAGRWLSTSDHKRIGLLFVAGSLAFLVAGGALGVVLRAELTSEGVGLDRLDYDRALSMHATLSTLLFLVPAWIGVATCLVPLQIGAGRLAFPRLHAFALWLFLLGGAVIVGAHLWGRTVDVGLVSGTPIAAPRGGAVAATSLAIVGVGLVTVSSVLAAVDLAVTILKLRTSGMTLRRIPLLSWATLVFSLATLLAAPVFLAGLTLLYLDQQFGGDLFRPLNAAGRAVWRHALWLFGRPEAYLLAVPGLGAACDIVATHARRPLLGLSAARTAIVLVATVAFGAWAAGGEVGDALVLPTYSPLTALVVLPVGLLVLTWLGTTAKGRPRLHPSLLFVAGAAALMGVGALNAAAAAAVGVEGAAWTTGHLHTVVFGPPTLLFFGAAYHWAPKVFGRHLSAAVGSVAFMGLFAGFLGLGLGGYLLGYDGAPAHLQDYPFTESGTTFGLLATVGGVLVVLGVLAFVADLMLSVALHRGDEAGDDPYQGLTLECATTSPPPDHNFEAVPEVRSAHPLLDLRTASAEGGDG